MREYCKKNAQNASLLEKTNAANRQIQNQIYIYGRQYIVVESGHLRLHLLWHLLSISQREVLGEGEVAEV